MLQNGFLVVVLVGWSFFVLVFGSFPELARSFLEFSAGIWISIFIFNLILIRAIWGGWVSPGPGVFGWTLEIPTFEGSSQSVDLFKVHQFNNHTLHSYSHTHLHTLPPLCPSVLPPTHTTSHHTHIIADHCS